MILAMTLAVMSCVSGANCLVLGQESNPEPSASVGAGGSGVQAGLEES